MKRTVMELGGEAPIIVLKDADLEAAAAFIGEIVNQGQICMITLRVRSRGTPRRSVDPSRLVGLNETPCKIRY